MTDAEHHMLHEQLTIATTGYNIDVNHLIDLSVGSIARGKIIPWYVVNRNKIMNDEGGHAAVVTMVAGLTIALLQNDPTLGLEEAAWGAGNEWRASIRSQWDDRSVPGMINRDDLVTHDDTIEDDPRLARIMVKMNVLTTHQQQALDLYAGGMGYQDISDEMNLHSRQVAYGLIKRGTASIRRALAE